MGVEAANHRMQYLSGGWITTSLITSYILFFLS